MILSTAGNAAFGPVGGFLGALAGTAIDNAAITALTPARIQPSRLAGLRVQASQEGAPIPIVYGRFRVTGQVIWASKFNEISAKRTVGGKGGARVVERSYTISFAIGLAEGPINGIGKVWANGNLLDLSTLPHRLYLGNETQTPDPLIEALEGLGNAPAFRGLAYIVFEDLPLGTYGDRIPQLSFEVMASPNFSQGPRLTDLARGVCLIPGAGEFAYATTPLRKILGPGHEVGENVHAQASRADFDVALDQLARDFPMVDAVSLVVAWFGMDLRAEFCQIVPKVEDATKQTSPRAWSVAGLTRSSAGLVSRSGNRPAYGGSPDDASVIEAIVGLKARGFKVTHNPFIMMDIAAGNSLPNPLGGMSQPPYPWRGRITCFPGIGQASSADNTSIATSQINAFFGTASAAHFAVSGAKVIYSGPDEWSYRRFVLHQAALTKAAGGVESFLIGSEMIGLTRVRGPDGSFPAVSALIALAGEVRMMLGPLVKISYGADWTEYGSYAPQNTNDLRFPLDPLWASANIDYIGLDWYAPLTDRRGDEARADIAALQASIEGGEAFDFYYANDAARLTKSRTPITDSAYNEPWVWRQKDVRSFWSREHYERIGGVRATIPTPWVPQSKPIALMELGFPAVDKGANRPSVFPDPKSSESGLPPFSNGVRDDVEQFLALEATLSYWEQNNPYSLVYQGSMMDVSRTHIWAWDARPYPHFPSLVDVWGDGAYAMLGHWLAGRAGTLGLGDLVGDVVARSGVLGADVRGITGYVDGFAIEAPTPARAVLENLFLTFGLEAHQNATNMTIADCRPPVGVASLTPADLIVRGDQIALTKSNSASAPSSGGRFTCYASERDYQPTTFLTPNAGEKGNITALASSLVLAPLLRAQIAQGLATSISEHALSGELAPSLGIKLHVGDRVALADGNVWRLDRLEGDLVKRFMASPAQNNRIMPLTYVTPSQPEPPTLLSAPLLFVLDLPAPFTPPTVTALWIGCAAGNWASDVDVTLNDNAALILNRSLTLGQLVWAQPKGPVGRIIHRPLDVELIFGAQLPQIGRAALMIGHQIVDIISWQNATLMAEKTWRLLGWVRGLNGCSQGAVLPIGTQFVLLDDALAQVPVDPNLVGATLHWQARLVSDITRNTHVQAPFEANALRPWPVYHVRIRRVDGDVTLSWTRRARGTGDGWGVSNAPLDARAERFEVRIFSDSGSVVRTTIVTGPTYFYPSAHQIADFGTIQFTLRFEITQIGDDDRMGMPVMAIM